MDSPQAKNEFAEIPIRGDRQRLILIGLVRHRRQYLDQAPQRSSPSGRPLASGQLLAHLHSRPPRDSRTLSGCGVDNIGPQGVGSETQSCKNSFTGQPGMGCQ